MFDKICSYLHRKSKGDAASSGIIGAFDDDEWIYEKKQLENENLGETLSSEFISMIEKREKNFEHFPIHSGNVATDTCSSRSENKIDVPLNADNLDIAANFTEITRFNVEADDDEYIIMMSKNSFQNSNDEQPTDIYKGSTHSTTNYGRNENTDEGASCIFTRNFSQPELGPEMVQENEMSSECSQAEDDRISVLTTKHASTSQDPIETCDNSSYHADEMKRSNTEDDTDTERDDMARNDGDDDGEKTLDCNDDKTEKSNTKSLQTNESTTSNDQEQRTSFYQTENLIPLKGEKMLPFLKVEQLYFYLNILTQFSIF